jgi:hypothetical protein
LSLAQNKIKVVHGSFGLNNGLPSLTKLDLGYNKLEKLPTIFFKNFKQLTDLNLCYNRFKTYSKDFLYMNKLQRLNLTGNYGYKLPNFFKFLPLKELFIEWPAFIDNARTRINIDADTNIHKLDIMAMNEVMEKSDFMNFSMYREKIEGNKFRKWDDRVAFIKALIGIRK